MRFRVESVQQSARAAEVLIDRKQSLIRRRETIADLMRGEKPRMRKSQTETEAPMARRTYGGGCIRQNERVGPSSFRILEDQVAGGVSGVLSAVRPANRNQRKNGKP